jgi:transcriptional regulator with XRE-family HTH domain
MSSNSCRHAKIKRKKIPEYRTKDFGIPLELIHAVDEDYCEDCGAKIGISIPATEGLIAAAAISRVMLPHKLAGREICFLRKALGWSGAKFGEVLDATAETVSRWENGKRPMPPNSEKLLRILTGTLLGSHAPAISFEPKDILQMKINALRNPEEEIMLSLQLVFCVTQHEKVPAEAYLKVSVDAHQKAA